MKRVSKLISKLQQDEKKRKEKGKVSNEKENCGNERDISCTISSLDKFNIISHMKKNVEEIFSVDELMILFHIHHTLKENLVTWLMSNPKVDLLGETVSFLPEYGVKNKKDLHNLFRNVKPGSVVESITREDVETMYPSSKSDVLKLIQEGSVVNVGGSMFTSLKGRQGSQSLKSLYRSVPLPDTETVKTYLIDNRIRSESDYFERRRRASHLLLKKVTSEKKVYLTRHDRKRIMKTNTHLYET